jgi:acyl transferase domain-containing protein
MSRESPETQARVLRALEAATARLEAVERLRTEPIAIIGVGCRFPGGVADPAGFWRLLRNGVDAVAELPAGRWDVDELYDPDPEAVGRTYVRAGGFLADVDQFDADFFGISPREAQSLDPQQRILLETAWEALERAGLTRERLRGSRTGVFVGITNVDYGRRLARALDRLDPYYVTGNTLNAAAGRLSYLLGLRGPSLAVDTACSSSLVAIHLACQSLRGRDSDLAVAAGVNLLLAPEGFVALSRARVLSPDGRCKTFDAAADGMGRAEGCGALVLKRLSDAQADGDPILALVRGSAVNQDGASSGLTVPNGPAQADVIRQALAAGRLEPSDIDYVEAHGTGTSLGDPIELGALGEVFGAGRPADRPLVVGSVKANIAHAESAAGVAGVIKTVLCLQHRAIPPQPHFRVPSPHVDWDGLPLTVPTTLGPWPSAGTRRRAGVSSFGLSGTNAHVVLEEAPDRPADPAPAATGEWGAAPRRARCILPLSAAAPGALRAVLGRYAAWLRAEPGARLEDLCFSAATTRDHHAERVALVAASPSAAEAMLDALAAGRDAAGTSGGRARPGGPAGVTLLFSGQGAQLPGMGAELYTDEPMFRRAVDTCAEILGRNPLEDAEGAVADTAVAQPALFVLQWGLAALWRSWGIEPAAVLGHSVGEYAAACVAGVLDLASALRLVGERARLMSALPKDGLMVAALAPEPVVAEAVRATGGRLAIAAVNAPANVVLSGETGAVERAAARLAASGVETRRLATSHAFHSPLMAPVLAAFRAAVRPVALRPPAIPFVSTLTGERADDLVASPEYWVRQVVEPVRFAAGVATLLGAGHRTFLEVGPQSVLAGLGRACDGDAGTRWIASLARGVGEGEGLLRALGELYAAGAEIDWRGVFAGRDVRRVALPTYPFQRKRHWYAEAPAGDPVDDAGGVWQIAWRERPPRPGSAVPARWLLLADGSGVGDDLAARARARGDEVALVPAADPLAAARHVEASLADPDARPLRIVHLGSLDVGPGAADAAGRWASALARGPASALAVVQAMARGARPGRGARLWLVTRGAQPVGDHAVAVLQAPVWGLGRVVALEHPDLWGGLVDLDPAAVGDAGALLAEADAGPGGGEVAHRGGRRLVSRLAPGGPAGAPVALAAHATYLVTGGLGGLGLCVAEWLVSRGARRLVLVGRRGPAPEARARLARLEGVGADVRVVPGDLADADAVARAVDEAERGAPLRGIVHAAGVLDDGMLLSQDPARLEAVMAGKGLGALHLDAAVRGRALDFVVFFSSVASVLGSPGQANYASANALLDALAAERRRRGDAAVSINWGPWAEAGMAARLGPPHAAVLRARGLTPWSVRQGLRLLGRLLRHPAPQVVAAGLDPARAGRAAMPGRLAILEDLAPADPATDAEPTSPPRPADRDEVLRYLADRIRAILRLGDGEAPGLHVSLQEQGLDSMMATELRNRIARELSVDVPIARFLAGGTIDGLADLLHRELALARLAGDGGRPGGSETEELVL